MRTQIGWSSLKQTDSSLPMQTDLNSLTLTDSSLQTLIDWHLLMQTDLSSLTLTDSS